MNHTLELSISTYKHPYSYADKLTADRRGDETSQSLARRVMAEITLQVKPLNRNPSSQDRPADQELAKDIRLRILSELEREIAYYLEGSQPGPDRVRHINHIVDRINGTGVWYYRNGNSDEHYSELCGHGKRTHICGLPSFRDIKDVSGL